MGTRILFVGDLHVREGEHQDDTIAVLDYIAQVAAEKGVTNIVQVGDVFESKSTPAERLIFADWLHKCPGKKHIIRGNHDRLGDLKVFDGYPNVFVYEEFATAYLSDELMLVALPWPEASTLAAKGLTGEAAREAARAGFQNLLQTVPALVGNAPFVVGGHLMVSGALTTEGGQPLMGVSLETAPHTLTECGASFVGLGHIHLPQEIGPDAHYLGSITCHDFGEQDEVKRVMLVDVTSDGEVYTENITLPARSWFTIEAFVSDTDEDGVTEIASKFFDPSMIPDSNIRYRYACTEDQQHLFDHEEIKERFAEAHMLKIVPKIERVERIRSVEVSQAKTVEEKVLAWGDATETEVPPSALAKLTELQEWISG